MRFLCNIRRTPVIAEIVALAAKHSRLPVEYRDQPGEISDMEQSEAEEALETGYDFDTLKENNGSLWVKSEENLSPFWTELRRLELAITKPLNEPVLEDDYPVHQGNLYVANGRVTQFIDGMNMTVGRWKSLRLPNVPQVTEVRRCDIVGRELRLPPKPSVTYEIEKAKPHKRRKPRTSNKIKKVR